MNDNHRVLVAFPAYNEEKYIASLVRCAKNYCDAVVVLDDGSSDGTAWRATDAGAYLIQHISNKGYGSAIQDILTTARDTGVDILVIIDADMQHDPADIPLLVKAIGDGYDMAIGSRDSRDVPIRRRIGGWALSIATGMLAGKREGGRVRDSQSGFRAYSREAVDMLRPKEKGMAVSSEITALAVRTGLKVVEVPVSVRYTEDSSTHNPWRQGFYTLWRVVVMLVRGSCG